MRIDWDAVVEDTVLAVLPRPLAARFLLWREDRRSDAAAIAVRRQDRLRTMLKPKPGPAEVPPEVIREGTTGLPLT
jgi:hypothetical protein